MDGQHYLEKIKPLDALLAEVESARTRGKSIVQCHGCFDLVHPGHIRYLEFARRQGDLLLVSLTGDHAIEKGAGRPYIPESLRAENLAALGFVNWVYIDPNKTAEHILRHVKPDIYVKGEEYQSQEDPRILAERRIVEAGGGRLIFSSGEVVFSSTRLLTKLRLDEDAASVRNRWSAKPGLDWTSLNSIISGWQGKRVTVVGDVIVDRYHMCDVQNVARESPMLDLVSLEEKDYIGGAAIVARHTAALGASTRLITRWASDPGSVQLKQVANKEGVELVGTTSNARLPVKTRFLSDDTKLFKLDQSVRVPLDALDEERLAEQMIQSARESDVLILCNFGYGTLSGALLARCLPQIRELTEIVAADVSGLRASVLDFKDVDLICPTEREVRHALNDYSSGFGHLAWKLLEQTRARHLILTLDRRGLVTFENPELLDTALRDESSQGVQQRLRSDALPTFARDVRDRLGCGDAMLAASSMALAGGASLIQAAVLGNVAAAIEIGHWGNVPVRMRDLADWTESLSSQGGPALVRSGTGPRPAQSNPLQDIPVPETYPVIAPR